jgi:hypothetical protein
MLKKTLNAYHNRAIATQAVIEELIKIAQAMSAANQRGVDLGPNDDEVAFYDALAANTDGSFDPLAMSSDLKFADCGAEKDGRRPSSPQNASDSVGRSAAISSGGLNRT